mmetsp:Transcript_12112/g.36335  ORF Transcript_12112/g.36335 Transcript_12112/m.36335 type:complete len:174 (-) Transcript_12112:714-1235(-)|eukprot:CAMPEP_0206137518 /NCGR_PEP_ID=MMETSP1473-20131121/2632_1 /ASSEMBLY_ACC=CAM_ASM_001109 /TAXON_ID=1461547 /ORGANISM="Stichococcus sp, Strain RCC1054" /LENGTH=173 /DNA_ID=CAMNT_0053530647 /DNA_START=232 /DNA_END=753 /DNA_ORIENTATION=+
MAFYKYLILWSALLAACATWQVEADAGLTPLDKKARNQLVHRILKGITVKLYKRDPRCDVTSPSGSSSSTGAGGGVSRVGGASTGSSGSRGSSSSNNNNRGSSSSIGSSSSSSSSSSGSRGGGGGGFSSSSGARGLRASSDMYDCNGAWTTRAPPAALVAAIFAVVAFVAAIT